MCKDLEVADLLKLPQGDGDGWPNQAVRNFREYAQKYGDLIQHGVVSASYLRHKDECPFTGTRGQHGLRVVISRGEKLRQILR